MKLSYLQVCTLLFLLLNSHCAFAQQEEYKAFSSFIRVNGLSLLDPSYPTIQPGIGGRYKFFGLLYSYGLATNTFIKGYSTTSAGEQISYIGHKQKLEFRAYDKRKVKKHTELYGALELFKNNFEKERVNGAFYDDHSHKHGYTYDYVKEQTIVWGYSLKGGNTAFLTKNLFINYSIGFGMRSRKVSYVDGINLREVDSRGSYFISNRDTKGKINQWHAAIELAIGYRLF